MYRAPCTPTGFYIELSLVTMIEIGLDIAQMHTPHTFQMSLLKSSYILTGDSRICCKIYNPEIEIVV